MISNPAKLNLFFNRLDWLKIEDMSNRIILQKTIFILQELGLDLNYNFNWYIYGPYSPSLTEDAFELKQNEKTYREESDEFNLSDHAQKIIERYNSIFGAKKEDSVWLELIASLLFLRKFYSKTNYDDLKAFLLEKKPKFESNPSLVNDAINFLKENLPATT